MRLALPAAVAALLVAVPSGAAERGTVRFEPVGKQANIPERYRLAAHSFAFEMEMKAELPVTGIRVYRVRFPSPVESPHPENNTVHAEYYVPVKCGRPIPGVVILDITGGDQSLSRSIAVMLAQKGIAGLFVQMAYYGPRRPVGSKLRLMSYDLNHTFNAVRQTVLDVRRATAWLESRPEIDRERLGLLGTSLGSLVGSLAAEMEPKLKRVVVLLGGAGLVDGYWDHPEARPYIGPLEKLGATREMGRKLFAPIDPITRADNLKDRKLLIIAGKKDEIVPPKMAQALWEATGRQKIVWFDCGHYTAALYLLPALGHVVEHLGAP